MNIDYNEHDQQIWEEELEDFIPHSIFDAHAHLVLRKHGPAESKTADLWGDADYATHKAWAERLYPNREIHYLFLGTPVPGIDVQAHNAFIHSELKHDPQSRANLLVTPDCTPEYIEETVKKDGFIGLKPYRLFTVNGNPDTCRINEFITEEQLEVANDLGLWITMHLSKYDAAADPENLSDLEYYTQKRYPNIKWILAHCARSFTYWPIRESIDKLKHLPNIYYDLSAVCDIRPIITLFKEEDSSRIFFGSDGTIPTFVKGNYVSLGRSWTAIQGDKYGDENMPHTNARPILVVYESLLSIKQAAELTGLTQGDIDAIFRDNAVREFTG